MSPSSRAPSTSCLLASLRQTLLNFTESNVLLSRRQPARHQHIGQGRSPRHTLGRTSQSDFCHRLFLKLTQKLRSTVNTTQMYLSEDDSLSQPTSLVAFGYLTPSVVHPTFLDLESGNAADIGPTSAKDRRQYGTLRHQAAVINATA